MDLTEYYKEKQGQFKQECENWLAELRKVRKNDSFELFNQIVEKEEKILEKANTDSWSYFNQCVSQWQNESNTLGESFVKKMIKQEQKALEEKLSQNQRIFENNILSYEQNLVS